MPKDQSELRLAIKDLLMLSESVYNQYKPFLEGTIADTTAELALLLEVEEVPEKFEFIIKKVVQKRFNRRKNEGMKSTTTGEARIEYQEDDFVEFRGIIQKYLDDQQGSHARRGKAVFL